MYEQTACISQENAHVQWITDRIFSRKEAIYAATKLILSSKVTEIVQVCHMVSNTKVTFVVALVHVWQEDRHLISL